VPQPQPIPAPRASEPAGNSAQHGQRSLHPSTRRARTLALRDRLAKAAVELTCHGRPEALACHRALALVEERIEEQFPRTFQTQQDRWFVRDAGLIHAEDETHPDCELCRRQALGLDLTLPLPIF
jgi:hypothetical protein